MDAMTSQDWIELCRRAVARQSELFAEQPGSAERTSYEGRGEGGDMTLVLDRRCEDIVFDELAPVAERMSLRVISEERGEVTLGDGQPAATVVVDPIDGSLNVRRTIPSHSLSIAVAGGDSMQDVHFGFVHDFGADEEFAAARGEGATLDGRLIDPDRPEAGLEVVGLESAEPSLIGPAIAALEGKAYRLRSVGSIAITLSYVAAGRFDAMLSGRPCRSVDAAAAQLIVREAGGSLEFSGAGPAAAGLGLTARYAVAAAVRPEHLQTVLAAQSAGPAIR
jgi:myo-inositol-1(or 4)-monophosphatase